MDRPNIQIRKILRSPSVKRKNKTVPVSERVTLERVLGLTVTNNAALATDPVTGTIAYPAGCVIVLYNPKKGKQSHIFNTSKKTLTCLAFSADGKHIVSGETGHQPAVRVWDLQERIQVAEFCAHKYGIVCVAFSPNLKYILSVGTEHDMLVNVWNWKSGLKVASNKVASKVTDVAFSEDSSMFVTVGNRHVKFWYLDASKSKIKTETVPLMGRNGILGEHQNNFFCGVCCGKGDRADTVFAITESGLLCEFNDKRLLSKWVLLRTDCANAITASDRYIFVGCANGLVRIFSSATLNFVTTMPAPHHLGVDVATGVLPNNVGSLPSNARYPDTVAICYSGVDSRLTCVYNDHSMYIWDVTDMRKVGKTRSFLFHSGAVWGIDALPCDDGDHLRALPVGSFVTCSSDNTIRVWNCDQHVSTDWCTLKRNIYSNELLKILYVDPDLNNLLDIAYNPAGKKDKTDTAFQEKNGVRCVRINSNGLHLASGDRAGNVRVHDLNTMKQLAFLEAHDSEVLCLEFTRPSSGVNLLATASRDRLLHIFDINHNYGLVQTLDDHSSAITAIRFAELDGQLMMLSCGVDKSLLFRSVSMDPDFHFVLNRHMVSRTTLYDMEVDLTGKFVATACQDRNIRIYNTRNGKQKKCYSGSTSNDGTLLRLELDPSGSYAATSSSDKTLSVYDFFSGECVASMFGHSEISTGIKYLDDLKHFVSVSVDGCIFVWRLPSEQTEHIREALSGVQPSSSGIETSLSSSVASTTSLESNARRETFIVSGKPKLTDSNDNFQSPVPQRFGIVDSPDASSPRLDYRFSVGQLPSWAKRQVLQESYVKTPAGLTASSLNAMPKGRWATRVDDPALVVRSLLDTSSLKDEMKMFGEDTSSSISSNSDVRSKVSFITDDDENNRDDEQDDEFKAAAAEKTRIQEAIDSGSQSLEPDAGGGRPSFGSSEPFVLSRHSSVSADEEEEDSSETKETVYYLPAKDSDIDSNFDSTFKVYEGAVGKLSGPDNTEEEDDDVTKSPSTPSDITKDVLSDLSSVDEFQEKSGRDQFDDQTMSREKFNSALKRLEDEAIDLNADSPGHTLGSRQSISALFLSRTLLPSQSRTLLKGPSQLIEQRNKELIAKAAEKKSTADSRDSGGGQQHRELSSAGPSASTTSSSSTGPGTSHAPATGRKLVRLGSTSGADSKPSIIPNSDLKLELAPSSSTLPRAAGRNSKGSTRLSTAPGESTLDRGSVGSSDAASDTSSTKRRSAAHSYRMQTESSMAKVALNKDVTDVKKKETLGSMRYPSTPNLPAEVKDDDYGADADSADKTLVATDDDIFSKPVWPARRSETLPRKDPADGNRNVGGKDIPGRGSMQIKSSDGGDRSLMPPPLSTSVPSSIQASFLAKAAKHRRTTMPESLGQAKDIMSVVAGSKTTGSRASETSAGVVIHGGENTSLSTVAAASGKRNMVASPLEPPERDVTVLRGGGLSEVEAGGGLAFMTRGITDHDPYVHESASKSDRSDSPASDNNKVTSPRVVKIGRCTSPLRPYVAKSIPSPADESVVHSAGQSGSPSLSGYRRQLPPDPRLLDSSHKTEAAADWRSASSGTGPSLSTPFTSAQSSAAASFVNSESREGSTSYTASDSRLHTGRLSLSSAIATAVGTGTTSRMSLGDASVLGHSSPSGAGSPDIADTTQTWMKRAQHMQQQWEQRQQPSSSTTRPTETPSLPSFSPQHLANSDRSKTETRISQHAIMHEIERYCEEQRRSRDQLTDRPSRLDLGSDLSSAAAGTASPTANALRRQSQDESQSDAAQSAGRVPGEARQQWEKAKQIIPFTSSSPSSSVGYSSRSQSSGASLPASDDTTSIQSLSRHSISTGSASSTTYLSDDNAARHDALPAYLTNPRRATNGRPSTTATENGNSQHVRRSRPWSRSAVANGTEQPNEGEPESYVAPVPREAEPDVTVPLALHSSDDTLTPTSRSRESFGDRSPAVNESAYPSDELNDCSKMASDLTQAVTRVTDMYNQLSGSSSDVSTDPVKHNLHQRALRMLHDSLTDASTILSKSLGVDKLQQPGDSVPPGTDTDATSRMMEAMLERYSQQLSSQVYELFKQKLDELQSSTKL